MANINLTPDDITRESLRVLHQKLNFCGNIVRDYDDRYADEGAKIGDSLRVRLPIQYATGTGATMATGTGADSIGTSTTLQVSTQRHVPMRFTSKELTLDIDSFSTRHVEPAMAKLAAMIENDVLTRAYKAIPEAIDTAAAVTFESIMQGRKVLQDNLAPMDDRTALMSTQGNVDLVVANRALFSDDREISRQYKEGYMGRFGSFSFYENSLLPRHTAGAEGEGTAYLTNAVTAQEKTISASDNDPTTGSLIVDTGTLSIKAGDVFTVADVFDVHHETKVSTGTLKQFTVLADLTGAGTLSIAPAIIASGPHKNVSAAAANNKTLTFLAGVAASTAHNVDLLFQKGFAAFATADLFLPKGTDMASRQSYDGISMRLVRDFSVTNDRLYTRLDVLYGFKVLRPELAVKLFHT